MPEEIVDETLNQDGEELDNQTPPEDDTKQTPPEDIEPEVRRKAEEKSNKDEDEEEIDPEDQKRISKIVGKEVGSKVQELDNKMEVFQFVTSKPEFAKYQNNILKYMAHPAYANIPVHNIAAIVASKDMQKIGAAKERAAQNQVNTTKNPGTTIRKPAPGTKDWTTASKEDFDAQRAKVLGRQGAN